MMYDANCLTSYYTCPNIHVNARQRSIMSPPVRSDQHGNKSEFLQSFSTVNGEEDRVGGKGGRRGGGENDDDDNNNNNQHNNNGDNTVIIVTTTTTTTFYIF